MEERLYSSIFHPMAKEIMVQALGKAPSNFFEESEGNLLGLLIIYLETLNGTILESIDEIPHIINDVLQLLVEYPSGEAIKNLPNNLLNVRDSFIHVWEDNVFFATSAGWEDSDSSKQLMFIAGLKRKLEELQDRYTKA